MPAPTSRNRRRAMMQTGRLRPLMAAARAAERDLDRAADHIDAVMRLQRRMTQEEVAKLRATTEALRVLAAWLGKEAAQP